LGNVIARFGGGGGRIAILAHLDTVGLLVKRINSDGTLGVVSVGGVNLKALPGAAVQVGDTPGLIGVRSQHQAGINETIPAMDDLYVQVDGGQTVEITTPVTYMPQVVEMGQHLYASPYLDNRAGCAVLLELVRTLATDMPNTVYLIGTVQEETTCAGAYRALAAVQPDAAVFVDGTVSYDTPETRGRGSVTLGAGPVLTAFLYTSGLNGWHAHGGLRAHFKQLAQAENMRYQQDAVHGLMSDARVVSWTGTPSALVGLPLRSKHAPLEMIHLNDLVNTSHLLAAFLKQPLPNLKRG
jgi:putative aminopeptidase FrvX